MYMVYHRYLRRNPPLSPSFCSSASPLSIRKPKRRVNANRYTRDRNYARILFLSVHTPSTFPSCQLVHLSAMVGVVVGGATDNIAAGLVNRRRRLHRLMLLPLRMAGEALLGHVAVVRAGRCRDLAAPVVVVRDGAGPGLLPLGACRLALWGAFFWSSFFFPRLLWPGLVFPPPVVFSCTTGSA